MCREWQENRLKTKKKIYLPEEGRNGWDSQKLVECNDLDELDYRVGKAQSHNC